MNLRKLPIAYVTADVSQLPVDQKLLVTQYMRDFRRNKEKGYGLMLYGPYGVGKTYAMAALTRAISTHGFIHTNSSGQKKTILVNDFIFSTGPTLFEEYALTRASEGEDKTEAYETCKWLVLNDLGEEYRQGGFGEQVRHKLSRLLRARVEAGLLTHITTNRCPTDKIGMPRDLTLEGLYGPATFSLLMEACPYQFEFDGSDRRKALT